MQGLGLLFSPAGRLGPRAFIIAVVLLYLAAAASQALTLRDVIKSAGLWPFLAAQIVLVWIWYALHAKRLRDAGKPVGVAVAIYVLSVVLLVIIAGAFYGALAGQGTDPNTASALGLILFVSIIAMLSGAPHDSLAWLIVAILLVIDYLPIILAVVTTVWAATRPTAEGAAA
jgi:uncharacterized membrane protein YhaH (DUF805 family)